MIAPYALLLAFQAPPASGSPLTGLVFQFVAIIAIIYFVMVRPQQRQRKQLETSLAALKKGDEVITAGGLVGEVIHIRETSKDGGGNRMDDRVTLKSGESRLVVERRGIARIVTVSTSTSGTPAS